MKSLWKVEIDQEMATEEPQWTSSEDFLTKSPLYTTVRVDGFYPPKQISFECGGECGKETTWGMVTKPQLLAETSPEKTAAVQVDINAVVYRCLLCNSSMFTVAYVNVESEDRTITHRQSNGSSNLIMSMLPTRAMVVVGVTKVGQFPEPSISLPKKLEKGLGREAAVLYRRALICRNNGYGLAAVGYMRRVVEDKTNELVEVAASFQEASGVDAETVAKMREALNPEQYTAYEDKLRIAAAVFPESLKVGSINPMKVLFGLVSKGLHGLSEAQCLEVADGIRRTFEYLFSNLRDQLDQRRAFVQDVKKLSQP